MSDIILFSRTRVEVKPVRLRRVAVLLPMPPKHVENGMDLLGVLVETS
ncbi:MAG TPA: hypothetical protein PLY52_11300 [Methanothrix sp.]|nr:hypothetical protein [Methanothrix sp.]